MANLSGKRIFGVFFFIIFCGCAQQLPYVTSPLKTNQVPEVSSLEGEFVSTSNAIVDLKNHQGKPTILVFSQDSCTTCAHEADTWREGLKIQANPNQVHIYTVLVGAILEDAVYWKNLHRIPWIVGLDPQGELFKKYCKDCSVPFTLVYIPSRGFVFQKNGFVSPQEIKKFTGEWEDAG